MSETVFHLYEVSRGPAFNGPMSVYEQAEMTEEYFSGKGIGLAEREPLLKECFELYPAMSATGNNVLVFANAKDAREGKTTEAIGRVTNSDGYLISLIDSGTCMMKCVGLKNRKVLYAGVKEVEAASAKKQPVVKADPVGDAVKASGLTEEEIRERISVLERYEIMGTLQNRVLELISRQPEGEAIGRPETLYRQTDEKAVRKMMMGLVFHHPMLLEGSKSVGKNIAWETVAWLLNRKMFILQCGENMTRSSMFGHTTTDNSQLVSKEEIEGQLEKYAESGNKAELSGLIHAAIANMSPHLKMTPGPVTEALIHENNGYGAILLLDEMNLAEPAVIAEAFNDLTDGHTESIHIDELGNFPVSRDLIIGGTQNCVGGEYLGTKVQNSATMSRWDCISLSSHDDIKNLLFDAEGADMVAPDDINDLNKIYGFFMENAKSGASDDCVNVRGFKRAVGYMALGASLREAVEVCVINTIPDRDERDALMSGIEDCLN